MEEAIDKWLFNPAIGRIVTSLIGILIVVVIIRFLQRSLSLRIKDSDTRYRVRKFITFIGYILSVLVLGVVFSDKLGGLTVALGVAGAGIAFALQELIASVAGWFAISFSHFYKTGHRVQLGGIRGDVIDIGVLRTTLMEVGEWVQGDLYNGRVVRIANSFVFKEPVFNYSGDFPFLWDEITIPVKYGSDYRLAKKILEEIAVEVVGNYAQFAEKAWGELVKKYLIEDAQVQPMITMIADENWMTFTIRYVIEYKKRRSTKNEFFVRILERFEETQGKVLIASGSMDVNLYSQK